MKLKKIDFEAITYIFLIVVFSGALSGDSEDRVYIFVSVYFLIYFFHILKNKRIFVMKGVLKICIIFVLVWLYGLILGGYLGNNIKYIVRNFAGMTIYLLVFPLSSVYLDNKKIKRIITFMSYYALFIAMFTYIMLTFFDASFLLNIPIVNNFAGGGGIGGYVQYYNRELIHVGYAISIYELFEGKNKVRNYIYVCMVAIHHIFMNDSGGDLLALAIIFALILLPYRRKISNRRMFFFLLLVIAMLFFSKVAMLHLFSPNDVGNARRIDEIEYITKNLTLLGNGLGADLGIYGATNSSYGTEIIYLNLFHKFGIFAVFIFYAYFVTLIKALKYMNRVANAECVIPLALMSYLVASIANPMLFSVLTVVSHILALRLIG